MAAARKLALSSNRATPASCPTHTGRKDHCGYLYLLTNSECKPGTLKVGRTNDFARRVGQYPKGSEYIEVFGPLEDCHEAERFLIAAMRSRFISAEFGREYFRGNSSDIREFFHAFCYERLQSQHMPWMPVPMDIDVRGDRPRETPDPRTRPEVA